MDRYSLYDPQGGDSNCDYEVGTTFSLICREQEEWVKEEKRKDERKSEGERMRKGGVKEERKRSNCHARTFPLQQKSLLCPRTILSFMKFTTS
jgi:hypothetical protein